MTVAIHEGDCLEVIPRLVAEGVTVDAIVTDPPYHLTSIVKRFGKINIEDETVTSKRLRNRSDGAARLARGFMGQEWDGGDIAFRPETWRTVASILRPGGFVLVFGGTRTHHRVWCAIEDAGLVLQDTIMWMFGSGFPKRKDMLKPSFEPVCVAYKPDGKRELQIDECRIETDWIAERGETWLNSGNNSSTAQAKSYMGRNGPTSGSVKDRVSEKGRWPANVCHDGSDEVMAAFAEFGEYGFNDSGSAARFFYTAKADADDRWKSRHPTVKPVSLIEWLVKLVTPPGGTFLDPFAGSGSAAAAAMNTGRNAILIEKSPEYCEDIRRRIETVRIEPPKGSNVKGVQLARPTVKLLDL